MLASGLYIEVSTSRLYHQASISFEAEEAVAVATLSAYDQVGTEQVGTAQVGIAQVGTAQVGTGQVGTAQVGTAQVGTAQVGTEQVGTAQVGTVQVGTVQVGTAQVGTEQVGTAQVGTAQVGTAQVGTLPQNFTRPELKYLHIVCSRFGRVSSTHLIATTDPSIVCARVNSCTQRTGVFSACARIHRAFRIASDRVSLLGQAFTGSVSAL